MKCDCVEFSVFVCLDLLWSSHTGHAHICEDAGPGFNSLNWLQVCQHIPFDMVSHLGPDFSKALKQIKIHWGTSQNQKSLQAAVGISPLDSRFTMGCLSCAHTDFCIDNFFRGGCFFWIFSGYEGFLVWWLGTGQTQLGRGEKKINEGFTVCSDNPVTTVWKTRKILEDCICVLQNNILK